MTPFPELSADHVPLWERKPPAPPRPDWPNGGPIRLYLRSPRGILGDELPSYYQGPVHPASEWLGRDGRWGTPTGLFHADRADWERWMAAAAAYAATVDAISAEVRAVGQRMSRSRWRRLFPRGRDRAAWAEVVRRYREQVRLAASAYAPVRREIEEAIRAEDRFWAADLRSLAAEAAERVRQCPPAHGDPDLARPGAARKNWVCASGTDASANRVVYFFRADVAPTTVPAPVVAADRDRPLLDLWELLELAHLQHFGVVWDAAASVATGRELGVPLDEWWSRACAAHRARDPQLEPARARGVPRLRRPTGGTGTGTGGFGVRGT